MVAVSNESMNVNDNPEREKVVAHFKVRSRDLPGGAQEYCRSLRQGTQCKGRDFF
jgi:hypothetical protein